MTTSLRFRACETSDAAENGGEIRAYCPGSTHFRAYALFIGGKDGQRMGETLEENR